MSKVREIFDQVFETNSKYFEIKSVILHCEDQWISHELPWITVSYVEDLLRNYTNDKKLAVTKLILKPVTSKGENYGGILVRIFVSFFRTGFGEVTTSYVLKTQIWNELSKRTLKVYDIHNKEMEIYERILPQIRQTLVSIGEAGDMFPEAIYIDRSMDAIVFEDLLLKQYKVKDRVAGLDHDHIVLGLEKLAKIQAASALLYEQDPTIYDALKSGMFTRRTQVYYTYFNTMWKLCTEELCQIPEYQYYGKKLKKIHENMIESACRVYDRDDGDFHVLTHGDLWVTNLMFNYFDDGSPKDVVIVSHLIH